MYILLPVCFDFTEGRPHAKKVDYLQYTLKLIYILLHIQPFGPTVQYVMDPFSIRYWPVRFLPYCKTNFALRLVVLLVGGLLDVLSSIFALFPGGFLAIFFAIYFAKIKLWLRLIRNEGSSEKTCRYYRIIELYNQIGHDCFSKSILPSLYTLGYWFALALSTTIVQRGASMPFELMMHFIGAVIILVYGINSVVKVGGDIVRESLETKHALCHIPQKYLRRKFLACREIRVYLNSVFYFDKRTCTVYFDSLINNTITVVLAI